MFFQWLDGIHGVTDSHIIEIQLDDFRNRRLRKPDALLDYIDSKVVEDGNPYYIVLDEVPGIHTIKYDSEADCITITHDAHSRKGFALGAVLAAEYTKDHSGLLTISDMFKF